MSEDGDLPELPIGIPIPENSLDVDPRQDRLRDLLLRRRALDREIAQVRAEINDDHNLPRSMPLICDRCGDALRSGDHYLYSFDLTTDVDGFDVARRFEGSCPGKVCNPCGLVLSDALVELATKHHLTSETSGMRRSTGHGQAINDRAYEAMRKDPKP